ncbi:phospholipase A2 inhibitor gamma subunit B-like [Lissotriton helveticus]
MVYILFVTMQMLSRYPMMKEPGIQILPAAKSIAIASFLAALITEGNSLSCIKCITDEKPTCTGTSVVCQSDSNACVSKLTQTITGKGLARKLTTEFTRSCGSYKKHCLKLESVTAPSYRVRSNSTCCNTHNCGPVTPSFRKSNTIPNGVLCDACYSRSSSYCSPKDIIPCLGLETMCGIVQRKTTGVEKSNVAFRGCASPDLCSRGVTRTSENNVFTETQIICKDGGLCREHNLFLVALTLLLLKLLP